MAIKLKIVWSAFAEQQLDNIFDYYGEEVNQSVALSIVRGIVNHTFQLTNSPYIGQRELQLKGRILDYRYLLFKNIR